MRIDYSSSVDMEKYFPGKSEMAHRMRAFDWSLTPFGHPETWPLNLITIAQAMLYGHTEADFFANICHEIRAPLTLMLGPLEDEMRQNPSTSPRLELVYRNCLLLDKLVTAMLDFSRVEAGQAEAIYAPLDLASLSNDMVDAFRPAIKKAGLQLAVDCPPLAEPIFADCEMWETILLNLLSNALKYTWQGEIRLSLRPAGDHVNLEVRDTGCGIPPGDLPHLFERFHRVKGVHGRSYEGTGIGLALVRELVQLHCGTIEVQSTVGKGSIFTVSLPFGFAHLPEGGVHHGYRSKVSTTRAAGFVEEALRWLPGHLNIVDEPVHIKSQFPGEGLRALATVSDARILLADDNDDVRQYLQELLAPIGTVEAVADGEAALAAALQRPPELILSDVMMPRMNGLDLLRLLRASETTRHIQVMLLSALAGEAVRVECIAAGADDYLVKPFSADELIARVETQIKLARMRRMALQHEQELQAEKTELLESMSDPFVAIDANWQLTYVNAAAQRASSDHLQNLIGGNYWAAFPALRDTVVEQEFRHTMAHRTPVRFEYCSGPAAQYWEVSAFPLRSAGIGVFARDISERKKMEEVIRQQAHHDALTALPNRRLFAEILDRELLHAARADQKFAICQVDLDKFKFVNDTLGHQVGDLLLCEVADRLRSTVRQSDTVARAGGDEFNILLPDVRGPDDAAQVLQKILESLAAPVSLLGHDVHISASIGATVFPDDGVDADTLLKGADVAMYHAKDLAGDNFQFYTEDMNTRTVARFKLDSQLRQSIRKEELEVYYQPQSEIASGRTVAAEALVRWRHPERGLITAVEFVPLAEETGFILVIDEWVLRTVCRQLGRWKEMGIRPPKVAVNLSAKQFIQKDLIERVSRILKDTGVDPEMLGIEITESAAMVDPELTIFHMRRLVEMGFEVYLDDFGTGYSSLSYLKKLPISKLKIDKSFVDDIVCDADDRAIITAVTALASAMNLHVLAEGVESENQLEFLRSTGCQEMQGYLFSRPLSVQEFTDRMVALL